ncbi:MAG TPA: extracellular solute-binding protein, partial [Bacilli bacterium]
SLVWMFFAGCRGNNHETAPADETKAPASEAPGKVSQETVADTSKTVKLKMFMLGDSPKDTQLVYNEINKKLKKDINAMVELEFIPWADVLTKIPLILSSGEDYDVISTANWNGYFNHARNGAFRELTNDDLLKYAPKTAANSSQEVFDSAMVDGKLYALPMNYHETTIHGYLVRGDLMKKYHIPDIRTVDDFGVYLDAVMNNEKDMVPWDTNNNAPFIIEELTRPYDIYNPDYGILGLNIGDLKPKLSYLFDSPHAVELIKKMQGWNLKGYWRKGALVSKISDIDSFKNGKSAASFNNLINANSAYESLKATHPEWDVRFYPCNPKHAYLANPYINNGNAINAKSKNPERALMMLDLFRNNREYNLLTTYGIRGKHFDISGENKLISLPDSANFPPSGASPWGWREDRFYLYPANGLSNYDTVSKNAAMQQAKTNIRNFTPDRTNIKSNDAAVTDIINQYLNPLYFGIVKETVEQDLQTVKEKMNTAGLDIIIQEVQKQLDAFKVILN